MAEVVEEPVRVNAPELLPVDPPAEQFQGGEEEILPTAEGGAGGASGDDGGDGRDASGGISVKTMITIGIGILTLVVVWSVFSAKCKPEAQGGTTNPIGKAACGVSNGLQWAGSHMGAILALIGIAIAGPVLGGIAGVVKAVKGGKSDNGGDDNNGGDDDNGGDDTGGDVIDA